MEMNGVPLASLKQKLEL